MTERTCRHCGQDIPSTRSQQARYCSSRCKVRADFARHYERRRAADRARYAALHGSPGVVVVRPANCQQCRVRMPTDRGPWAKYCSDVCKQRHRNATRYTRYRGPRPCRWCGEQFVPRQGERPHVTYCSNRCRDKRSATDNAARRAISKANWRHSRRAQFAGAYITAKQWAELVDQHEGRCAYCGVSPNVLTQDHVVPVNRGGAHSIDNIVPACQPCNSSKGDKLFDEWALTPGYARCVARAQTV